jgi:hypothetical protein
MSLVKLIEKVAKKYNIKVNSLPNGVLILLTSPRPGTVDPKISLEIL